jgi:hypothetical protein
MGTFQPDTDTGYVVPPRKPDTPSDQSASTNRADGSVEERDSDRSYLPLIHEVATRFVDALPPGALDYVVLRHNILASPTKHPLNRREVYIRSERFREPPSRSAFWVLTGSRGAGSPHLSHRSRFRRTGWRGAVRVQMAAPSIETDGLTLARSAARCVFLSRSIGRSAQRVAIVFAKRRPDLPKNSILTGICAPCLYSSGIGVALREQMMPPRAWRGVASRFFRNANSVRLLLGSPNCSAERGLRRGNCL